MKSKDKFIDAYEIYYRDMLNSNINAKHKANNYKDKKDIIEENTLESKKDHFDPSKFID